MAKKKALIEELWDEQEEVLEKPQQQTISNFVRGEWIDRIYGGGGQKVRLLQGQFGKEFAGTITEKKFRRYRKDLQGIATDTYYQRYHHTSDGRWFDNGGMPCEKPHHEPKQAHLEEEESE